MSDQTPKNESYTIKAIVTAANYIEHRFQKDNQGQVEVKLDFATQDGSEKGASYMDLSSVKWFDSGKNQGKCALQVTMDKLATLGINIQQNPASIQSLVNTTHEFFASVKDNGSVTYYLNVNQDKVIDPNQAASVLAGIFGGAPAQPAPQQQMQQQAAPAQDASFNHGANAAQPVQQPVAPQQQAAPVNAAPPVGNPNQFVNNGQPAAPAPAAPQGWA